MDKKPGDISSMGTVGTFLKRGTCSETSLCVLNHSFGNSQQKEEQAAAPLAGGVMRHGYQCGLIWGAALAAGAEAYRRLGAGPQAEARAIVAAQRLLESFRNLNNGDMNCLEITELDRSSTTLQMITYFLIKGGTIGCFRRAAKYAPEALEAINAALSDDHVEVPLGPVSCAAAVAQKMGASEMNSVTVAGLAGGIGLSGGACGALGAAIWLTEVRRLKEQGGKVAMTNPGADRLIERFLKVTDYEFECAKIAGRKFESVGDHASYLCDGGCSKIIEVLAAGESAGKQP